MWYTFHALQSGIPSVRVLRGMGVPKITGGYARWGVVERPKRKSATEFDGIDPIVLSLPILFDGVQARRPIEADIGNLWRMRHVLGHEPSTITVDGGIPSPARGIQWVIQGIEEGDNAIWDVSGGSTVRFRQDATVTLLEKVTAEVVFLTAKQPGNTRGTTAKTGPGKHTVKAGETADKIANKHDVTKAKLLDANNIRDPKTIQNMIGQDLIVP